MSRAYREGLALRRKLGLRGQVDMEAVASILGLEVVTWPLSRLEKIMAGDVIGVAERLDARWRRWVVAHAIGHRCLHPGNHLWIRLNTDLGHRFEWEAEDFARALLIDVDEARSEGFTESWELALHFGVPVEVVVFQQQLRME